MTYPTFKTHMYILALSRALKAPTYSLSEPGTDSKNPLPNNVLVLRGRDMAICLPTALAFVDGPIVSEEAAYQMGP